MMYEKLKIGRFKARTLKRFGSIGVCFFSLISPAISQFIGSTTDSALTVEDVRKGTTVEYSLQDDAKPGEEFRWEVTGGKIITAGAVGEGTAEYPSVIEFTQDLHTIEVQWQPDDSTSEYFNGSIMVQKKTIHFCASPILKLNIRQWSMPTASIDKSCYSFSVCSGDPVGGYVIIRLTGAADFTFKYSIKSNGLHDENGQSINTEFHTITTSNDTAHIALPVLLINPSEAASKYYTIEIISMNDAFTDDGEALSARKEFTITVYPAVNVGTIESVRLNKK